MGALDDLIFGPERPRKPAGRENRGNEHARRNEHAPAVARVVAPHEPADEPADELEAAAHELPAVEPAAAEGGAGADGEPAPQGEPAAAGSPGEEEARPAAQGEDDERADGEPGDELDDDAEPGAVQ